MEEVDFRGVISLNDNLLGKLELGQLPLRVEVHFLLQQSNQLRIEIEMPVDANRPDRSSLAGGLTASVRLEIHEFT